MERFETEDIERRLREIKMKAEKDFEAELRHNAVLAGPPALLLVAGLAAFYFLDLHSPYFKYAYAGVCAGAAWFSAALWLVAFLKRKRIAGERGLRADAFSLWLYGESDGLPFRAKLPGYINSGEAGAGFSMKLELPLSNTGARLVLYRLLTRQVPAHAGAPLDLPAWLGRFKMAARGQVTPGVLSALGDENALAPLFHPDGGLRLIVIEGRRLRAEFLRGDPYVLTEPKELAALASRLARAV